MAQLEEVPRSESGLGAYLLDVDTEIAKRLGDDLWALCAGIVQRTEKKATPEALHRPNWSGPSQRYATPDLTWVPCQETMVTCRGRFVALMGSK